mmetsp:Transcript_17028/g.29314  ORF Transcript_17028/g.29314 Transcript_17028/m.29314 type:complete len:501 (-) Transcript_17028:484-1986(-)|eukprot:CAMPEP_0183729804 /NCGR_PEP_ID=MMETSP0737-20130205/31273_1 /TAXON_ID=385413 /ORGANISM="Thalassiosira miniscula, Strain CCMP1093" /LENGTH=500 /DNA_ID=CAMNT_0025962109 /DNA_START=164 /DNA_END=1666 /DNA_ORIENTATION=+
MTGSGSVASPNRSLQDVTNVGSSDSYKKRRGLDTESAREVAVSRRNLTRSVGSTKGSGFFDKSSGEADPGSRRSLGLRRGSLTGVNYGAASIKRFDVDQGIVGVVSDPSLSDSAKSRRISAGEGAWLIKKQSGRGHKSLSSFIWTSEKKTTDASLPNSEEAAQTMPMESKPKKTQKSNNAVHFSSVSIQYYPTIVGVNPSVTSGPPLELAWEPELSATDSNIPIDMYEEARRPHRRNEWDLALSRGERESRLLELGCTREDIAAAVRETSRIKAQRANTVLNMKIAGLEEFADEVRRQGTKLVGLRKSSDWLYNDWKKNKNTYRKSYPTLTNATSGSEMQPSVAPSSDIKKKSSHQLNRSVLAEKAGPDSPKRPEYAKANNGPAFGITHISLSSRTGFGDGSDSGGLWPFAIIKVVHPGSPAHEAGLSRGDRLIKLGDLTAVNHNHCKAIPELGQVSATKEHPISAVVEGENGVRRTVTIQPREWDGRGYFGFLLREIES